VTKRETCVDAEVRARAMPNCSSVRQVHHTTIYGIPEQDIDHFVVQHKIGLLMYGEM
jgi:hypothetical protein